MSIQKSFENALSEQSRASLAEERQKIATTFQSPEYQQRKQDQIQALKKIVDLSDDERKAVLKSLQEREDDRQQRLAEKAKKQQEILKE